MSHPSLLWLRYWLPFLGCRSYAAHMQLRHLIVLAFGRNTIEEKTAELAAIGVHGRAAHPHEDEYERNRRVLKELRFGTKEVPSVNPGSVNRALALALERTVARHPDVVTWVQWEVALALDDEWIRNRGDRMKIIWPNPIEGRYISADDILHTCHRLIEGFYSSDDLLHTGLLAHQHMITRCMIQWHMRTGSLPIIPPHNIDLYDSRSVQRWTKSAWAWWPREMIGRWFIFPWRWTFGRH